MNISLWEVIKYKFNFVNSYIITYFINLFLNENGCNALPQTGWLETTGIYFLTLSGVQKSEIKVSAGPTLSERSRENPSLPLATFWWLLEFLACGSITLSPASVFTWLSSLCLSMGKSLLFLL